MNMNITTIKTLAIISTLFCIACGEIESEEEMTLEQQQQELTGFATRSDDSESSSLGDRTSISIRPQVEQIELSDSEMSCISKAYRIAYSCSVRSRQDACVASARRHIERCTDGVYSLTHDDLRACHVDGVETQDACLDEGAKQKVCRSEGEDLFSGCVESVLFEVE